MATRRGAQARHGTLQLVGYGILIGVLLLWLWGLWAGFTLLLLADDNAVVSASNQQPPAGWPAPRMHWAGWRVREQAWWRAREGGSC